MSAAPVLKAEGLRVGYGGKPVLLDATIELRPDEVLCVIGHNGAGKSTLMRALFGLITPEAGRMLVDGAQLDPHVPRVLASHGIAMVPEGRGIFPGLTVRENFALGMWSAGVPEKERDERVEWVLQVLPPVRKFYDRRAGLLSGGQQQMVSIGRAILARPRCLLMDEPSIGLAPKLFQDLMQPIRELQQSHHMSILLIEQNVREALKVSDRVVVMKAGAIILEALPGELKDNARLMELY
ncbi:ABC transporter ATP-binding protein [Bradyrhizobium sp. LHD-71]|uniref:ABC transporter ATP-binding protein n=1 Tax=Bradyrhizobium sp. LHD-71 TaxID=3072141 RepID=UPI00280E4F35|nr:ABC transporter ATP-binding protein [Bradyrhizobium sp. LHD-71]MDQ8731573.1 ABC transporter ATP-binding protein [Bradyrhizobium sp. LHD-71]